ncbi:MAG: YihY/virulence factor BrkB family protein [Oscillospiraceae bacterium]|nr:YihY/virulence factor BrkB family protein [Oscillospiraceae bacterium]
MGKTGKKSTGFWAAARQMLERYYIHDVARMTAALTYYLLFAVFPLLIFISMVLGALALDVEGIVRMLETLVPPAVVSVIRSYLEYVSGNTSRQLMWFCLVFSIWFPMRATGCLMQSMRRAYGFDEPENILKAQVSTLLFSVGLIVTIVVSALLSVAGRRVLNFVSQLVALPDGFTAAWGYLRFALMALLAALMLSALHMLALGRRMTLRQILPGVGMSVVSWLLVSLAFSYYVEHFAHYTELYGSIATIVVSLLWLYMSGAVLILGGELNGTLLHMYPKHFSWTWNGKGT